MVTVHSYATASQPFIRVPLRGFVPRLALLNYGAAAYFWRDDAEVNCHRFRKSPQLAISLVMRKTPLNLIVAFAVTSYLHLLACRLLSRL